MKNKQGVAKITFPVLGFFLGVCLILEMVEESMSVRFTQFTNDVSSCELQYPMFLHQTTHVSVFLLQIK